MNLGANTHTTSEKYGMIAYHTEVCGACYVGVNDHTSSESDRTLNGYISRWGGAANSSYLPDPQPHVRGCGTVSLAAACHTIAYDRGALHRLHLGADEELGCLGVRC